MKIIFKTVKVRNFLSFGNTPTTFTYTSGINIVTGTNVDSGSRNGVGKSSLLVDSISFAIYGKTLRGAHINKDELVNRINRKNCSIEVEFDVGATNYRIIRTIKPSSLTAYENGTEIKFDSMKHTQDWLEEKVGISHTCFSNILVLNINNSQPFLSMDAAQKREVLEDILSMKVYGDMSDIAKDRNLTAKGDIKTHMAEFKSSLDTLKMAKENHNLIVKEQELFETNKRAAIKNIEEQLLTLRNQKEEYELEVTDINYDDNITSLRNKQQKISDIISKANAKISVLNKDILTCKHALHTLKDTPHCPTCHTPTNNPIIIKYINDTEKSKIGAETELADYSEKVKKAKTTLSNLGEEILKNEGLKKQQLYCINKLNIVNRDILNKKESLEKEKNRTFTFSSNTFNETDIKKYDEKSKVAEELFNNATKSCNFSGLLRKILGEDGIRKFVISKVLPFLNSKVNQYMKTLGSDLTIKFDSNLTESIITRNRDECLYNSFSGGEKKRIDLSVLLALMDIAKLQNSIDTNILVLDEVLDTAMDGEGVENFLVYLKDGFKSLYPDKSVYIITHRKELSEDYYDRMIVLEKKNGFTNISKIVEMK